VIRMINKTEKSEQDFKNLNRFVDAQNSVYSEAIKELESGCKKSHWMWFIFPQIKGLGSSVMARKFAIESVTDARAYLEHPILGSRLIECSSLVLAVKAKTAKEIFGYPDYLKFHSSMTLFSIVSKESPAFKDALDIFFNGQTDQLTLDIIEMSK